MNTCKKLISLFEIKTKVAAKIYSRGSEFDEHKELKEVFISGVSSLEQASDSEITIFSGKNKYKEGLSKTRAKVCLVDDSSFRVAQQELSNQEIYFIVVKDLNLAYARLMVSFYGEEQTFKENISKDALIDDTASIGKDCNIMLGAYIGKNAKIGNNVKIYSHVFIGDEVEIGDNCIVFHAATILNAVVGKNTIIHSGARIGKDGFRYATDETGKHIKVPHIGRVVIGNDVEIGANSTIDRGGISDTVIGDMCKLDNLVQIGHNVVLGKGCFVVAQVGIAGSVVIGDYVAFGGQAGIADNLTIGNYSKVAAQSGVMKNILEKEIVMGSPAQPIKEYLKQFATIKKITKKEKT
jgi:UDP-3-O-[3-hydroxymyristoyl] glucosamine N-acyltransferase